MEQHDTMMVRRRCPVCRSSSSERICPKDGTPTLVSSRRNKSDPSELAKGTIISGRYRIDQVIGSGAFGRVFSASHLLTGQDVALKVLNDHSVDDDDRGILRFFQEARVTARLAHPNTVRVFDFGQDDSGLVYLVMEYLKGKTLRQELSERKARGSRFTEEETVEAAIAVTRSLSEAHAQGLVHRDLKPENIMMHRVLGDEPQIKVLDFGIVKQSTHALTMAGQTPCTPAYASPEQVIAAELDGRSDLYSLAILMFELLTGSVPFIGHSVIATLQLQLSEPPPDVRSRTTAPISEELALIIGRALRKQPDERFFDAAEMRAALEGTRGKSSLELKTTESVDGFDDSATKISAGSMEARTPETSPGIPDQAIIPTADPVIISELGRVRVAPGSTRRDPNARAWAWGSGAVVVIALAVLFGVRFLLTGREAVVTSTPIPTAVASPAAIVAPQPTAVDAPPVLDDPVEPPPMPSASPRRTPRPPKPSPSVPVAPSVLDQEL